jgi:hypothetical protein
MPPESSAGRRDPEAAKLVRWSMLDDDLGRALVPAGAAAGRKRCFSTDSHGNSAEQTRRHGPAPVRRPVRRRPLFSLVAASKPAKRLSRVDLPHPLAPTMLMNSRQRCRDNAGKSSHVAMMVAKVFPTWRRLILATESQAVPLKQMIGTRTTMWSQTNPNIPHSASPQSPRRCGKTGMRR